jgi:hypothetical protein
LNFTNHLYFIQRTWIKNVKYYTMKGIILAGGSGTRRLGCKTPFRVFVQLTGEDYFLNESVALIG